MGKHLVAVHELSTELNMGQLLVFQKRRVRPSTVKVALTDKRVEKLIGEGFRWDAKIDGLAVRITRAGAKSYVFRRQVHGQLVNITLGKTSGMTVDAARRAALQLNGDTAAGRDIRAERKAVRAVAAKRPQMLADAFDAFKAAHDRRPSTKSTTISSGATMCRGAQAKACHGDRVSDIEAAKAVAIRRAGCGRRASLSYFLEPF